MHHRCLNVVIPFHCGYCNREISSEMRGLCARCRNLLIPISADNCCKRCGIPLVSEELQCLRCRKRNFSFDSGASCYLYEGIMSRLLLLYKKNGSMQLANFFADILWASYTKHFLGFALTLVPPSASGYKRRGFNHMLRIAHILHRRHKISVFNILSRKRSSPQKTLTYEERRKNLLDKIYVRHLPSSMRSELVLLDDLFTSGSSLEVCSHILKESGIKDCHVLTIAVV